MTANAVHVAVYDTLADWEIGHVTAHLNEAAGPRVVTVGASLEPITTMGGLRLVPDMALDDLRPADSAMLILAGSSTWTSGDNQEFAALAASFVSAGVPVAAICGATYGLASVGVLDDRAHTSNAAVFLEATGYRGGAHYVDELAVTDRNVVTASGIAPVEFAREVLALLQVYEPQVLASWYKLYGQHDPAGYFELMAASA